MGSDDDLIEVTARLAGARPDTVETLRRGRNNVVARVTAGGRRLVVKRYFSHPDDPRDRLGTEFGLLSFLWDNGLRCIPEPLAMDASAGAGLYADLSGEPLGGSACLADGLELAALLARMRELGGEPAAATLPHASEAAFTIDAYLTLVRRRLERLRESGTVPTDFLEGELVPMVGSVLSRVTARAGELGIGLDDDGSGRTLSPGDIGFHNALRLADGSLAFVDFEYGGWDEPANVIAAACLAPGVPLPESDHPEVLDALLRAFAGGSGLGARVRLVYPLLALKWSLILLNEFAAVGSERRRYAGALDPGFEAAQLEKSRRALVLATRASRPDSFLESLPSGGR